MISPVLFKIIARVMLPVNTSSAPAERMFNDLGMLKGDQRTQKSPATL